MEKEPNGTGGKETNKQKMTMQCIDASLQSNLTSLALSRSLCQLVRFVFRQTFEVLRRRSWDSR